MKDVGEAWYLTQRGSEWAANVPRMSAVGQDERCCQRRTQTALWRYGQVYERIQANVTVLANGGLYDLKFTWEGLTLPNDVAYLHSSAASSVAATTTENKLLDLWIWYDLEGGVSVAYMPHFGFQVSGATLPAAGYYVLYYGVMDHQVEGMTTEENGSGTAATSTMVPRTHFHLLHVGGVAYALRSRESGLSVQAGRHGAGFCGRLPCGGAGRPGAGVQAGI